MFFHINGVEVYEHRTPSNKAVAKSARLTHIRARQLAISITDMVAFILLGVVVGRFISASMSESDVTTTDTIITLAIGGVAIIIQIARLIAKGNLSLMMFHRLLISEGSDRQYYVTAEHFSFRALVTDSMRLLIQSDNKARDAASAFFSNPVVIDYDRSVNDDAFTAADLAKDHNAKLELIKMAERLIEGIGLDESDHFEALRSEELDEYSTRLAESIEDAEQERRALDTLAQHLTVR